ncbi:MAG: hypothetical protein QXI32_01910 [Candidatus Bathyarchaeia archaeon]
MLHIVLIIAAVVVLCGAILLSLKPSHDQPLVCPFCNIGFTADLYFFQQNTLTACPFCHQWMVVTRVGNKNIAKKPFA